MNDFETRLANRMHDVVDTQAGGVPPTQHLLARGRQARLRRRAVVTGGVAAVVVAAAVVTAAVPWSEQDSTPVAEQEQTPAVRLAAAVAASDNTSYRVRVTTSAEADGGAGTQITEGAFDPASRTGYLTDATPGNANAYLERLVDGVRYVGCANCDDQWKQYPGTHDRLAYADALDAAASASADPEVLFEAFEQAGAKITQTDTGFHFEVSTKNKYGEYPVTLVGDVTLSADDRIASVTYRETITVPKKEAREQPATTTSGPRPTTTEAPRPTEFVSSTRVVRVELSGYGTPVAVERPADVVVVEGNK